METLRSRISWTQLALFPLKTFANYDAVFFDCDGILVDTEPLKLLAWQKALAHYEISLTDVEYMAFAGNSSKDILLGLSKQKQLSIPDAVIPLKNSEYHALHSKEVPPLPKMVAFATQLLGKREQLGIKIGVTSSAPMTEILRNLNQIGLNNVFDLVLSGRDDLGAYHDSECKNKPKPYIYIEAAKRLNVNRSRCLVFEDTSAGAEAATAAGMEVVHVLQQSPQIIYSTRIFTAKNE